MREAATAIQSARSSLARSHGKMAAARRPVDPIPPSPYCGRRFRQSHHSRPRAGSADGRERVAQLVEQRTFNL